MDTVYIANALGFSSLLLPQLDEIAKVLALKFHVIEPFAESKEIGTKITSLSHQLRFSSTQSNSCSIFNELAKLNHQIGQINRESLDGSDVDSGVAAEIGYAFASGKQIYGLRTDFRLAGDNYGSEINLQVEYFIHASHGTIFHSLPEIHTWIDSI